MSDLLGAASLLVGVAGLLYGVCYPELKTALEFDVPTYGRDPLKSQVRMAMLHRALPISVLVGLLTLALAPPAWDVVAGSASALREGRTSYDAVRACFLIVFAALVVLAAATWRDLFRLIRLWQRLNAAVEA